MTRQLELTALQEHVLRYLASNGFADPPDGPRLKAGATVREISAASRGLYDPRKVTQCVRSLAKATAGNADHLPRRAWTRAINPAGGSTKGDDVQWVATPAGRYMTGVRTLADRAVAWFIEDLALGDVDAEFVHEHRGLFHYTLTLGDASIAVVMPGRPLEEIRWIDLPGQGKWMGWPSVKVEAHGRPWLMAVRDATSALTGVDFTPVEPIRKRLRMAVAAAGVDRGGLDGSSGGGERR
ncbi:MAG TPA: hypothetical protein VGO80_06360 [Solirubrobacteraceae bacterium]|jgi:hypothetical protein|nr:hypothetical protein [Solirubrobacteraceae bacterium]